MIDYQKIIDNYFPADENRKLRDILLLHSKAVADMAVEICRRHPELNADEDFVYAAAMLHDIGIVRCDADGIACYGTEPYICHGTLGAKMIEEYLDAEGITEREEYMKAARVCARHTGTGITVEAIRAQHLPLPEEDLQPETMEEKVICYADKFFSKTKLDRKKSFEQAEHSLKKFGEEGVAIFRQWHERFGC